MVFKQRNNSENYEGQVWLTNKKPGLWVAKGDGVGLKELLIVPEAVRVLVIYSKIATQDGNKFELRIPVAFVFNPKTMMVQGVGTPKNVYTANLEQRKWLDLKEDVEGIKVTMTFDLDNIREIVKGTLKNKPIKEDFERITGCKLNPHLWQRLL